MNDPTIELPMPQRKRTRLSPEARREQLLDCAREIILSHGFATLTMEAVAEAADVSNPLVYKYFPSKLALLQELLVREFLKFHSETEERLRQTSSFEELPPVLRASRLVQPRRRRVLRETPSIICLVHSSPTVLHCGY